MTAWQTIEELANHMMQKSDKPVSRSQAITAILEERPDLWQKHENECNADPSLAIDAAISETRAINLQKSEEEVLQTALNAIATQQAATMEEIKELKKSMERQFETDVEQTVHDLALSVQQKSLGNEKPLSYSEAATLIWESRPDLLRNYEKEKAELLKQQKN